MRSTSLSLLPSQPVRAPLREEEKAERQRQRVRRFYHSKLNTLQSQRDQVQTLEAQYEEFIVQKRLEEAYPRVEGPNEALRIALLASTEVNLLVLIPVAAPLTEAEKAERQRVHVRRAYYSKLNHLQALKKSRSSKPLIVQKRRLETMSGPCDVSVSYQELVDKYADLTELKEELRQRNVSIRVVLTEHQRFAHMMEKMTSKDESTDDDTGGDYGRGGKRSSQRPSSVMLPTLRAPTSADLCREIALRSYAEIARFRASPHFLTTGVSVFGWRDKRFHDGERLEFILTKTFQGITALDLMQRTWNAIATPRMALLYSPSMSPRVYLIQDVDNENVILFRVFSTLDGLVMVQSVFLVAYLPVPTGHTIIVRSLGRDLMAPYEPPPDNVHRQWHDFFVWLLFEHNQHATLSLGGQVDVLETIGSDAWLLELLSVVLRWENMVIGPIVGLENAWSLLASLSSLN
ncbi:hypothetical protein Poli38472_013382 [Pythium oligandrum]|uniref:Uncharacterized protein n=1 Tax=Pythium oligandrum TaxID=41045 RepID=A0A8K1C800_PYTOL|nr:hypothetical protein Poli38472_013382 [Pythium oligandrum]|eukprot:TMW57908.1 hypothetical protein Poli38472_013382 [Pythium oligandrum]